jgi:hypothetical protein
MNEIEKRLKELQRRGYETTLKPCPFCGRPGQLIIDDGFSSIGYTVSCGRLSDDVMCFASVTYDRDGDINISFPTPQEAAEEWNKRAEQ